MIPEKKSKLDVSKKRKQCGQTSNKSGGDNLFEKSEECTKNLVEEIDLNALYTCRSPIHNDDIIPEESFLSDTTAVPHNVGDTTSVPSTPNVVPNPPFQATLSKRQRQRKEIYESRLSNSSYKENNTLCHTTDGNNYGRENSREETGCSWKFGEKPEQTRKKNKSRKIDSSNEILDFGGPSFACNHCGAMLWYEERAEKSKKSKNPTFSLCCRKGRVKFPLLAQPPKFLQQLLSPSGGSRSTQFKQKIRAYNSLFAFSSTGGRVDNSYNNGGGPYCFRLNGQNHHKIGSLKPLPGNTPKFCQLYIYDTDHEIQNRLQAIEGSNDLDENICVGLLLMLDEFNCLVKIFRMVRDRVRESELVPVKLILKASRSQDGRSQNMPATDSIAGLIVGNIEETIAVRDIVVDDRKLGLTRISDLHPSFMALQYPLLFPYGEDGFQLGVQLEDDPNNPNRKRKEVTMMEYACFRIQQRMNEGHTLILSGKLFQTYIVDLYTCIEEDRLHWVRINQSKLRAELYCGIKDAVFHGDTDGSQVGKRIVLPSSFTGGQRYMMQNYQDAIALCRVLGNPDLFITFTSNPKWSEIKEALKEIGGQRPDERPDIVARVFKMKLDHLIDYLQKRQHFGVSIAVVYTIEFQKRGLPHAHILLWLHPDSKYSTPLMINTIIHAEIPDKDVDPVGYEAVAQFMIHGPCGKADSKAPCMYKQNCKKHFPKSYVNDTIVDDGGFPIYRRRNDCTKWVEKNGQKLDNSYVVPYNRDLLVKYQAHINVEWCNRGRSIKYLFKYVTKGPDHLSVSLRTPGVDSTMTRTNMAKNDEIQYYLDCRYVSAPEAIWRIYGFDIHYRTPPVERLPFHLPDEESILFKDTDNLNEIIDDLHAKKSKFNMWMEANKIYPEAQTLTYAEFSSSFVWKSDQKVWKPRKIGRSIGRIVYSHPTSGERFYLRLLLNIIKGPTSYAQIRTKDGTVYETYKEACQAWRLLDDDKEWEFVLEEASFISSGQQMRNLFSKILLFCEVINPLSLWEKYWKFLAEGIVERERVILEQPTLTMSDEQLKSHTLADMQYLLLQNGKSLQNFRGMPLPDRDLLKICKNKIISEELNFDREELRKENEKYVEGMNSDQKIVYDTEIQSVYNKTGGLYFLYGHGGTGKTYVWKAIISKLRSEGRIVLPVASSGIASILLPRGRTAHSRFQIPIILKDTSTCGIRQGSAEADLLKQTSLIIWDEAPMVHKHAFEAVDRSLRDILGKDNETLANKPFGGLTVILGGDFRQILPVVPKGSKHDIVHASISRSYLWNECRVLRLTKNMRLQEQEGTSTSMSTKDFSDWVLQIGNGTLPNISNECCDGQDSIIEIPEEFLIHAEADPIEEVISATYPSLLQNYSDPKYLDERAILTARNEVVDIINNVILDKIPSEYTTYLSSDNLCMTSPNLAENEIHYPTEFLNTLEFPGMPNHEIKLKVGTPIMLLRNLSPSEGLCNGTRLVVTQLLKWIIEAEIISGSNIGSRHFISRTDMTNNDSKWPFHMKRRQLPVRTCFVMTINKSQGQTLKHVGLYLPKPCFTHGQLYVAVSRVTSSQGLKIIISNEDGVNDNVTENVVYKEIFNNL